MVTIWHRSHAVQCLSHSKLLPLAGQRCRSTLLHCACRARSVYACAPADGRFAEEIGSKAGKSAEHLHHGLFAASQQLMGMPKHSNKTVLIFTNNADPSAGSKPADGWGLTSRHIRAPCCMLGSNVHFCNWFRVLSGTRTGCVF